MLAYQFDNIT